MRHACIVGSTLEYWPKQQKIMLIRQSKSNMNDQEVHLLDKFVELYKCTLAKTKQQPASVLMSSSN